MDGSTPAYKHIIVSPIAGTMGAEIQGVDLAALNNAVFEELYDAWLRHHVVVLRDQDIRPDQQLDFALRFGEIHYHPYMKGMEDHPEILEIVKEPGDQYTFGSSWHTDQMFNPQPAKATMLYAKETPSLGGDTIFANMLREPGDLQTEAEHPLFRTHPETGRKALYIGNHVKNLHEFDEPEAEPILNYLRDHSVRPEFTCRVSWEPGTLTIWDNRSVQHFAVADYNERRRMHRITIAGDTPF